MEWSRPTEPYLEALMDRVEAALDAALPGWKDVSGDPAWPGGIGLGMRQAEEPKVVVIISHAGDRFTELAAIVRRTLGTIVADVVGD